MKKFCPACEVDTEWLGSEGSENCDSCGRVMSLAQRVADIRLRENKKKVAKKYLYILAAVFMLSVFIFLEFYKSGSIAEILFNSTAKVTGLFIFGLLILLVVKIFKKLLAYLDTKM